MWEKTGSFGSLGTLEERVEQLANIERVEKRDLHPGDRVIIKTRNSVYSIYALGDDHYLVSGGWFDRQGLSPAKMTISGCTWGGRAIKADFVAARGLCLEFGNQVMTTRIQQFRLIRREEQRVH